MVERVLEFPTNFSASTLTSYIILVKFFKLHLEGTREEKTVELRSDACEGIWNVKREGRRLTVGWKEFAMAHDYRIGDVIVFRYQEDLVFHVTGFGPSFREIQYVHSSNNKDDDEENIRNFSMKEHVKTESNSSQDDDDNDSDYDDEYNMGELLRNKHVEKRKPVVEAESDSSDQSCFVAHVRTWTLILKFRESSRSFYMRAGWKSFCHDNGLQPGDSIAFKLESNNTQMPLLRFFTAESKCAFE